MAVRKATRSNPQAQPLTQQAKTRLAGGPEAQPQQVRRSDTPNKDSIKDPQLKAQLFDTLSRLNRGYGIAVAALDRLRKQDRRQRPGAFPAACLNDFRNRTEELRASANRDLLRLMASREELEAERFRGKSLTTDER